MTDNDRKMIQGCEVDQPICAWRYGQGTSSRETALYEFNNNLNDETGTYNATSPEPVSYTTGVFSNAAIFQFSPSVVNEYAQTGFVPTEADINKGFTLFGWIKIVSGQTDRIQMGAGLAYILSSSIDAGASILGDFQSVSLTIPKDQFFLHALTFDGRVARYYIDGTKELEFTPDNEGAKTFGQLEIGRVESVGTAAYGHYDRCGWYPFALSETIISAMATGPAAPTGCTAALGVTGDEKCFNTRVSCQDPDNYTLDEPQVIRLVMPSGDIPKELKAIPAMRDIEAASARIRPGKDLGERAQAAVTLDDFSSNDIGVDPYALERRTGAARNDGIGYNPEDRSTFWAKWRTRNPYQFGAGFRIFQGTREQVLADPVGLSQCEVRHYIQETFTGPTSTGSFTITAKDVLKLADDERAQAPKASTGELAADITAGATSATIDGDETQYGASGFMAIGREVVGYTRTGTSLTLTRGEFGTEAKEHKAGDVLQECLYFNAQKPSVISRTLLQGFADVNPQFINSITWDAENDTHIAKLYTRLITKPTSVRKLVGELSQQAGFFIWTDESVPEIKFKAIRQPSSAPAVLTPEGDIRLGSLSIAEQPKKRRSQVWVFFNQIDPTDKPDEDRNYASRSVTIDAAAEGEAKHGRPAIEKIYGAWLPANGKTIAEAVADRVLARFTEPPRKITFQIPWDNPKNVQLGEAYDISTGLMPTLEGLRTNRRILVLGRERGTQFINVEAEEFLYTPPASATEDFIDFDVDQNNVNLYDEYTSIYGTPDGTRPLTVTIAAGVVIGSNSTGAPAFHIDTRWPVGQTITVILEAGAYIAGAGGNGGDTSDVNGRAGGVGLLVEFATTIDNSGTIQGGGGGGGATTRIIGAAQSQTAGGGGAAGRIVGQGGDGADSNIPGPQYSGADGTLDAGGTGGTTGGGGFNGGNGGDPGQAGANGTGGNIANGTGGAAGAAVDGVSNVTYSPKGDVLGSEVN